MDSQSNLIHINYIKYLKNLDIRQLELEIINYYSLLNTDSFENDLILRKINTIILLINKKKI
jgi:hypothetical protein